MVGLCLATTLKCLENSFHCFWHQNMKKCSFCMLLKINGNYIKTWIFFMEVALAGMETVGDLGNPKKKKRKFAMKQEFPECAG